MIHFLYPELFLLAIPLWLVYRRWCRVPGMTGALRLTLLLVLLTALTGPGIDRTGRGLDIVLVADRSRSLRLPEQENIRELIQNLQRGQGPDDSVGVVTFGSNVAVESILSHEGRLGAYSKEIHPDGSDLESALHEALDLLKNPHRSGRILVLSDGEANGPSPVSAARRARDQRVPIDYRDFRHSRTGDVAVETLLLPETVAPREPFQFSVLVHSDREVDSQVTVLREGKPFSEERRHLTAGMNRLLFRDLLEQGGLFNYEVRVKVPNDPLQENNRGAGIVRVDAGPRLLVLNHDGQEDNLVRALQAARIPLDVAEAKLHPLTQDSLERYRAVVLENVPAADLGRVKMERLAQFVTDLGGGLLVTGGERSFGSGGYFKSPLDDVLPVSMEIREEHRRSRIALAVALDRSGSMAVTVKGGRPKMELANIGTAECVRMLSAGDSVAVIAVDSAPHIVQPLIPVTDPDAISKRALGIISNGGGIYIYEALVAAGNQIIDAEQSTKHIILFADAADSEAPGDYKALLEKYDEAGITVSVIGLGKKSDVDARLLEDIAKRGKGNIMFTDDAEELPRLFTQDALSVTRSSFVKKDTATQPSGIAGKLTLSARLMGELPSGGFPKVDGYNLSYLKPNATQAVVSTDEYSAPWSAFWYRGLGRTAALTLEVDGRYTGQFSKWPQYADFLVTQARWVLGGDQPDEAFLTIDRAGQDAIVTLELDPDRASKTADESPTLNVISPGDSPEAATSLPFQWQGPNTLQARFRLVSTGTYRTVVRLGERRYVRGPAITLPYSPEFTPRVGLPSGSQVLRSIADLTGGKARIDVVDVFAEKSVARHLYPLLPWLLIAAVVLLMTEIAGRRLGLWLKLADLAEEPATKAAAEPRRKFWQGWKRGPKPVAPLSATAATEPAPPPTQAPQAAPSPVPQVSTDRIYDQAKLRAKKRSR